MATAQQSYPLKMTAEDYLAFEETSEIKHEYVDGLVFPVGQPPVQKDIPEHRNIIIANLLRSLKAQKSASDNLLSPASIYVEENVVIESDITIVYGEAQFKSDTRSSSLNPTIVIEVMSPSSEAYDRGDKFEYYRKLASLQHYVLVSQDKPRIEGFTRQASGLWTFTDAIGLETTFTIETGDFKLVLADVYADIPFDSLDDE